MSTTLSAVISIPGAPFSTSHKPGPASSSAATFSGDVLGSPLYLEDGPAGKGVFFVATTSNDDQVTWMQQGRAAFTVLPFARYAQLNRQEQSKYPGRIKAVEFPISAALKGKVPMASCVEFWAMCIPNNARDKDLAWSFIQTMSSKAVTLGAARNGNGPARTSTFSDPSFAAAQPMAAVEAKALANARVPLFNVPSTL
jgi:ABC-type glycerol-3-phosphate transport system substrate-binding protein